MVKQLITCLCKSIFDWNILWQNTGHFGANYWPYYSEILLDNCPRRQTRYAFMRHWIIHMRNSLSFANLRVLIRVSKSQSFFLLATNPIYPKHRVAQLVVSKKILTSCRPQRKLQTVWMTNQRPLWLLLLPEPN